MEAASQTCSLKDWAALISALSWPILVIFVIIFFRSTLVLWISTITNANLGGFVTLTRLAEATKNKTQEILSSDSDFDRIEHLLNWNILAEEVRKWAAEQNAPNPSDMGLNNFRRFLFDIGLPRGQNSELKREADGTLKYQ